MRGSARPPSTATARASQVHSSGRPRRRGTHRAIDADRSQPIGKRGVGRPRLDLAAHQLADQLVDQEAVAAGGVITGGQEVGIGAVQRLDDHDRHRRLRKGRRPHGGRAGQRAQLVDRLLDLAGLVRAGGDDHRQPEAVGAAREVGQPAQGWPVTPVRVVDQQKQRPMGGGVGREPVEAVQRRQRRLEGGVGLDLRQHWTGECSGARQ
jgi:hypothetical protein